MLYIEKDDPREAPESGDKKPDPDKKQKSLKAFYILQSMSCDFVVSGRLTFF